MRFGFESHWPCLGLSEKNSLSLLIGDHVNGGLVEIRLKPVYRCIDVNLALLYNIFASKYSAYLCEWVNIVLRRFLHNHGDIAIEGSPKLVLCPTLIEWLQGLFIVHSTIDKIAHSRHFNSLEHCVCTTSMTNIRPGLDSNPVVLSFKPQPDQMSHRRRPCDLCTHAHSDSWHHWDSLLTRSTRGLYLSFY